VLVKKDTPFAYKSPFSLFLFSVIEISMSAHLNACAGRWRRGAGSQQGYSFHWPSLITVWSVGNFISGICLIGRGGFGSTGPRNYSIFVEESAVHLRGGCRLNPARSKMKREIAAVVALCALCAEGVKRLQVKTN
jgi:hypothetical protein